MAAIIVFFFLCGMSVNVGLSQSSRKETYFLDYILFRMQRKPALQLATMASCS